MNHHNSATNLLEHLKPHVGGLLSFAGTTIMAAVVWFGSYKSHSQHTQDIEQDHERRLELLENSSATHRELDEVKRTVDRIENKLDRYRDEAEIQIHHGDDYPNTPKPGVLGTPHAETQRRNPNSHR